ncbi:MAG: hypothetical protein JO345_31430 [Streptosporangiaceae bacterium]|nr:hypothetical protein [Streptosporangiaceae bacterium]
MIEVDAEALTTTPVGLLLLAELAGLNRFDFLEQIGEPHREVVDVVSRHVAARAASLDQLAGCNDRLVLLSAFAAVMCPGAADTAAAPHLATAAASLLPVARSLAIAPGARWWWEQPDGDHQRWLAVGDKPPPRGQAFADGLRAQTEADEEEERHAARELPWPPRNGSVYSGIWWSPPLGHGVFTTTGPIGALPAVGLGCLADSAGEEVFQIWDIEITSRARIWEIAGPDDWGRLTARYPRDVTVSRRHDWFRMTGRDVSWVLPDWPKVAQDWDGVHLSIAGFITATGFATTVGDAATVLIGWDPDQTLWLNDVFTAVDHAGSWTGTPGLEAFPDLHLPWLEFR